ncbi:MAG: TIR domain-containing protein [Sedimenticola sp.]
MIEGQRRFKVGLSFPGEHRELVGQAAESLEEAFGRECVLYDQFHEAEFAKPNLYVHLPGLYKDECDLIVIFLCKEYSAKDWCKMEWRAISNLISERDDEDIMLFRMDDVDVASGEIAGLYKGDGYLDINNHSGAEVAGFIFERLEINSPKTPTDSQSLGSHLSDDEKNKSIEKYRRKIRGEVRGLLEKPHLVGLQKAISREMGGDVTLDEVVLYLCRPSKDEIENTISLLHRAVDAELTVQQHAGKSGAIMKSVSDSAADLLGWVVTLAVKDDWVVSNHRHFELDSKQCCLCVPKLTELGLNIAYARLVNGQARFGSAKGLSVTSRDGLNDCDLLEAGTTPENLLDTLQKELWLKLFPKVAPPEKLTEDAATTINDEIWSRRDTGDEDHYLVLHVRNAQEINQSLYSQLIKKLPNLRVLSMAIESDENILIVMEGRLMTQVRRFLEMIRKYQ